MSEKGAENGFPTGHDEIAALFTMPARRPCSLQRQRVGPRVYFRLAWREAGRQRRRYVRLELVGRVWNVVQDREELRRARYATRYYWRRFWSEVRLEREEIGRLLWAAACGASDPDGPSE